MNQLHPNMVRKVASKLPASERVPAQRSMGLPRNQVNKPSQFALARQQLTKKPLRTTEGAIRHALSTGSVNAYVQAVPLHIKQVLFPGYAGFNSAREFFSSLNVNARGDRLKTLLMIGASKYSNKVKRTFNRISK
jgi:hypothetical protein